MQRFPGYFFHIDGAMTRCLNQDEAIALGPGYQDHPWTAEEKAAFAKGLSATPQTPVPTPVPAAPPTPPPAPETDEERRTRHATELYKAKVADILPNIAQCPSIEKLDVVLAMENENPKGARKSVVAAIEARRAELTGQTE